jgi:hypothetical protein
MPDFQKLSKEELRSRLEAAAAKLSDEALHTELRLAGIPVPEKATREEKVKLYTQIPDAPVSKKALREKKEPKTTKKSDGDKLLEKRKQWLEEWNTWDDARLVKRLAKLGFDGEGLSRAQLLDELMQAESDAYLNRWNPQQIQKVALGCVGVTIILTFGAIVIGLLV